MKTKRKLVPKCTAVGNGASSVHGNVIGRNLCDSVCGGVLNVSPKRRCIRQSNSVPLRDQGLQVPEVVGAGLSGSPKRRCVCQSYSVPCWDQGLQVSEVPGIGPSVPPNTRDVHQSNSLPCHDLRLHMPEVPAAVNPYSLLQSIYVGGVSGHSNTISGHHDNTARAAHTSTFSEWQSGTGTRQPAMSASIQESRIRWECNVDSNGLNTQLRASGPPLTTTFTTIPSDISTPSRATCRWDTHPGRHVARDNLKGGKLRQVHVAFDDLGSPVKLGVLMLWMNRSTRCKRVPQKADVVSQNINKPKICLMQDKAAKAQGKRPNEPDTTEFISTIATRNNALKMIRLMERDFFGILPSFKRFENPPIFHPEEDVFILGSDSMKELKKLKSSNMMYL
ncbi:hypothetical protein Tco_0746525 [Tanacetum coccineum]